MMRWRTWAFSGPAVLAAVLAGACGSPTTGPNETQNTNTNTDNNVASVAVASPIGDRMALGRTVQLTVTALDADGSTVSASFTWTSSDETAATVSAAGLVTGRAEGTTTITASTGSVSASLTLGVVDADLDGIDDALTDEYTSALVAGLPTGTAGVVGHTLGECTDAVTAGHINNLDACLDTARGALAAPSNGDEIILFSLLGLFIDHATRLLNL